MHRRQFITATTAAAGLTVAAAAQQKLIAQEVADQKPKRVGLIGACVLQLLSESHFAYLVLFGLTTAARLATLLFLRSAPDHPLEDRSVPGPEAQLRRPVSTGGQV